jgi:hypothetical protein
MSLWTKVFTPVFLTTSGTPVRLENANAFCTSDAFRTSIYEKMVEADNYNSDPSMTYIVWRHAPLLANVRGAGRCRVGGIESINNAALGGRLARSPLHIQIRAELFDQEHCGWHCSAIKLLRPNKIRTAIAPSLSDSVTFCRINTARNSSASKRKASI